MDDDVLLLLRTQQLAAVHLVCLVVAFITYRRLRNRNHISLPTRDMMLHRLRAREEMLSSLSTAGKCCETIDQIDQLLSTNEISLENLNSGDNIEATCTMQPSQMKSPNETTSKSKKSKKRKVEEEDAMISTIMSSLDNVADAIREITKVLERSRPRVYSAEEIYNELELMGVGLDVISRAYLFLVERPEKARALFGCPLPRRMTILKEMMGSSN